MAQVAADGNAPPEALFDRPEVRSPEPACGGSKRVNSGDVAATVNATRYSPDDDELWSFKTVVAKTGLCRSSIYAYVARGIFPRQRRLGPRRVAWLASDVRVWIASRPF
jgi:prophage regulatory protein